MTRAEFKTKTFSECISQLNYIPRFERINFCLWKYVSTCAND